MSSVGSLEDEAKKRKQRLMALRAKKDGKTVEELEKSEEKGEVILPKPIFRSYKPADGQLKDGELPQPKLVDVSEKVSDVIESAKKAEPEIENVDLASLAPRKPDWDLKRDVAKKLEKLDKRTQRAIAELIRERLQGESREDGVQLARAVDAAEQEQINEDEDD